MLSKDIKLANTYWSVLRDQKKNLKCASLHPSVFISGSFTWIKSSFHSTHTIDALLGNAPQPQPPHRHQTWSENSRAAFLLHHLPPPPPTPPPFPPLHHFHPRSAFVDSCPKWVCAVCVCLSFYYIFHSVLHIFDILDVISGAQVERVTCCHVEHEKTICSILFLREQEIAA